MSGRVGDFLPCAVVYHMVEGVEFWVSWYVLGFIWSGGALVELSFSFISVLSVFVVLGVVIEFFFLDGASGVAVIFDFFGRW